MPDEKKPEQPKPITGTFKPRTLAALNARTEQMKALDRERNEIAAIALEAEHGELPAAFSLNWSPEGGYTLIPSG